MGDKVNFLDIEKDNFKDSYLKFMLKPETMFHFSRIVFDSTIATLFENNNLYYYFMLKTLGALEFFWLCLRKKYFDIEQADRMALDISNTVEYKECKELYEEFVNDVAVLVKNTGLKNPIDFIAFLDILFRSGIFSIQSCAFAIEKGEKVFLPELAGARVTSGRYVCRYASSFLADVLNAIGIEACPLRVKMETTKVENFILHDFLSSNHVVTAFSYDGQRYLYDLTNSNFCKELNKTCACAVGNRNVKYIYCSKKVYVEEDNEKIKEWFKLPFYDLIQEEVVFRIEGVLSMGQLFDDDIIEFRKEQREKIENIARLELKVSPRGKDLKEWYLTKE